MLDQNPRGFSTSQEFSLNTPNTLNHSQEVATPVPGTEALEGCSEIPGKHPVGFDPSKQKPSSGAKNSSGGRLTARELGGSSNTSLPSQGETPQSCPMGGLADTVVDATPKTIENQTANGFSFDEFSSVALQSALDRAVRFYHEDRLNWNRLMLTGMRQDWSWKSSAKKYEQLYQETTARASMAHGP